VAWRLVDGYGYARFEHNFYRAPSGQVGQWVCVRAGQRQVELYDALAKPLAHYERAPRGAGQYVPPPETNPKARRRIGELLERFIAWGQAPEKWAREVRQRKRYAGVELARVVDLQEDYRLEDLLAAIEHALQYGAYDARSVGRILEARAAPRTPAERLSQRTRDEIRRKMASAPVHQRGTAAYGRLLAGPAQTPEAPAEQDDEATQE
jgi:hypothetical protein